MTSRSYYVHSSHSGGKLLRTRSESPRKLVESLEGHELLRTYLHEVLSERTARSEEDFDFVVSKQLAKLGLRLADIDEPGTKETVEFEGDIYKVYVIPYETAT